MIPGSSICRKGSREFVDALAVAGRPINPEVAYHAAELSGDELPLVSSLRAAQFLRTGGAEHTLELYHDRIRQTLAAQLDPLKVTRIHRRLAQAIEARGLDDPEALFEHYLGAGERVRAATHAAVAARKAASALAFDRAAAFYRRALELAPSRGADVELKRGLAEALVNAGRPAEAAEAYLEVAQVSPAGPSLDFKRRAAQQLLMGGHIKEGLDQIRSVLAAVGFTFPAGPKRALFSLLMKRAQIRLRGLGFKERDVSQIPESDLVRIDTCWAVSAGLGAVDLIRGADFQSRHLLLALKAGEPYRVARALAFEAAQIAMRGGAAGERAGQVSRRAKELVGESWPPARHRIINLVQRGECVSGRELEKSCRTLRARRGSFARPVHGGGVGTDNCEPVYVERPPHQGEIAEVSRRVPRLLSAALDQGNHFAATDLRTRLNLIWLAQDDPDQARAEVIEALKAWPHEGFHLQHYSSLHALVQNELYTGDAEVAWKHIEGQWSALEHSMLLRFQVLRIEANHLRARVALASVAAGGAVDRLDLAEKLARQIEREKMPWAIPFVGLVRGAIAHQRSQPDVAAALAKEAIKGFEAADMRLYAAAARRRLGETISGEKGRALVAEADEWMADQGFKNPT